VLDDSAREWGAVNTVLFEAQTPEGHWLPLRDCASPPIQALRSKGYNTDADATLRAIQEDLGLNLSGASVLLLGVGGAGRTAALKLAASGINSLWLVNRTQSKADELARELARRAPEVKVQLGYPSESIDLVVNATSLGLQSADPLPFDPAHFSLKQARYAYDMIYRPAQTRFLGEAQRAACKTANGLGMLLYQGAKALEIWSGKPAPLRIMKQSLHEHVYGGQHLTESKLA
jgi:shikimate dehydrogenase